MPSNFQILRLPTIISEKYIFKMISHNNDAYLLDFYYAPDHMADLKSVQQPHKVKVNHFISHFTNLKGTSPKAVKHIYDH